jgi:tetratricopeptide (TPR) repeat protein
MGLQIQVLNASNGREIDAAFTSLARTLKGRADALYVALDPLVGTHRIRINTLALAARLLTMHGSREGVEAGGMTDSISNETDSISNEGAQGVQVTGERRIGFIFATRGVLRYNEISSPDGERGHMPTLRIHQHSGSAENRYLIEVSAEGIPGFQPQSLSTEIEFALSPQDRERIRWYLEDFLLEFCQQPAPQIARRVEALMAESGETLFRRIFEGSPASIKLWAVVEPHLSSTRIEVTTDIAQAATIPWELIRDPDTKTVLALSAQAFVRSQRGARLTLALRKAEAERVRILLVICRPKGGEDVPFRSVAGRLVRLNDLTRDALDLDVLRPPTYEQLATTLRLAKERERPFHVVHFDGHGVFADPAFLASAGTVVSDFNLDGGSVAAHGFLVFEDPASKTRSKFVDGFKLGTLLRASDVPLLVLNACRSAFAEPPAEPKVEMARDVRAEVQAYGSLAQAVVEAGAAGVVAMRYSVYAVMAAQFVAKLYGALARGRALGEAVTWARKNLADNPERRSAYEARPLQDWSVPVVWERVPLRLWPEKTEAVAIRTTPDEHAAAKPRALDKVLPATPDVGFYGRDETLYDLDRAFDTHSIVLMHAYAGSGKTATAAEFGRWYALTGGVNGPILFSSFERHLSLARVLDKIGDVFGDYLAGVGVQWDTIKGKDPVEEAAKRCEVALQVLRQKPVLWIWDNVESVTGFPAGCESEWSAEEQRELRAFLSAIRNTKAKFLLTSRRDEQTWLGDLPRRVQVPPMPMQERLQLAAAITNLRGRRLVDLPDLTPLLRFTDGNPLTILVTVRQALREGIAAKEQLEAYVATLRAGQVSFHDEPTEGRSRSLGASLSYGYEHAFSDEERKILALLHLFQGFVDAYVLSGLGAQTEGWSLDAVRGLTHKQAIKLLDRAAEVGLLIPYGKDYFSIHPAVPWFFRAIFNQFYPSTSGEDVRALRAFTAVMGLCGDHIAPSFASGGRNLLNYAARHEHNLLAALRHSLANSWWRSAKGALQGIYVLYFGTGRRVAWRQLLESIVPHFIDIDTNSPLPGREEHWTIINGYRSHLALEEQRWRDLEKIERAAVEQCEKKIDPAVLQPENLDERRRNMIRSIAVSTERLGHSLRWQNKAECLEHYQKAAKLFQLASDRRGEATCALHIGGAYMDVLHDLDAAEKQTELSLELFDQQDREGCGKCFSQLGKIVHERFRIARKTHRPNAESLLCLDEAIARYRSALGILPESAIDARAEVLLGLGNIFDECVQLEPKDSNHLNQAMDCYRNALRMFESVDNLRESARTRYCTAETLFHAGCYAEAHDYARSVLAGRGVHDADIIENTRTLLSLLDRAKSGLPR